MIMFTSENPFENQRFRDRPKLSYIESAPTDAKLWVGCTILIWKNCLFLLCNTLIDNIEYYYTYFIRNEDEYKLRKKEIQRYIYKIFCGLNGIWRTRLCTKSSIAFWHELCFFLQCLQAPYRLMLWKKIFWSLNN